VTEDRRPDPTTRILQDFVREVSDDVVTAPWEPGSRGLRRRHGRARADRRMVAALVTSVAVVLTVALLLVYGPRSGETGTGVTGGRPGAGHTTPGRLRSVTFGGAFQPDEEVGADGALWLIGPNGPQVGDGACEVERLDPASLSKVTFPVAACGINMVAGGDTLYLEHEAERSGSNDVEITIETISVSTHVSTVLTPVAMTVVGSERAHTQLAYADGWLWLYGYTGTAEVDQISPTTGAVVHTFTNGVPGIGGTEPLISGGPGGVWLAGGPGGSSALALLSSSAPSDALGWTLTPVPAPSPESATASSTVEWLVAESGRMWVGEATETSGPSLPGGDALSERIVVLNGSGTVERRSPVEDIGSSIEAMDGDLYTVDAPCGTQSIWRVDRSSLRTSLLTRLRPALDPCLSVGYRSVAGTGRAIFVLYGAGGSHGTVLDRIEP